MKEEEKKNTKPSQSRDRKPSPQSPALPKHQSGERQEKEEDDGLDAETEIVAHRADQWRTPERDGEGDGLADEVDKLRDGQSVRAVRVDEVGLYGRGHDL